MKDNNSKINVFLNKHKRMYYTVLFCVLFSIVFVLSFTVSKLIKIKKEEELQNSVLVNNDEVKEKDLITSEEIKKENKEEVLQINSNTENNETEIKSDNLTTKTELKEISGKNENTEIKNIQETKKEEKIESSSSMPQVSSTNHNQSISNEPSVAEKQQNESVVEVKPEPVVEEKKNPVPTGRFIYKHNSSLEQQIINTLRTAISNDEIHSDCGTSVTNGSKGNGQGFTYRGMYQMTTSKLGAGRQNFVYVEDEYSEYSDGSSIKTGNTLVYIY